MHPKDFSNNLSYSSCADSGYVCSFFEKHKVYYIKPLAKLTLSDTVQGVYGTENRSVYEVREDPKYRNDAAIAAGVEFRKRSSAEKITLSGIFKYFFSQKIYMYKSLFPAIKTPLNGIGKIYAF